MNRSFRDHHNSTTTTTTTVVSSHHHHHHHHSRRGRSLNSFTRDSDENLDLFSRSRPSLSLPSTDHIHSQVKLGNLSITKRNGLDDLLSSTDAGKHDYDWLLTPPQTPLHISSETNLFQSNLTNTASLPRSASSTKPSRLSSTQLDNVHSSRPARSSSVTRSSISSSLGNNYSSNRSTSILNTSSASVSSHIRPSSPVTRSSSNSRPSTPSSRSASSRSSTPSKARSAPSLSSSDRIRPSQSSRPSTPTSRPHIPANLSFPTTRSNSRPSTPTRRNSVPTSSPSSTISASTGRALSNGNGRSLTSTSRPSSPSPRIRSQQPVFPPDFPLDTPPNLRTTLPDRPVSAGRSSPGASLTSKVNLENPSSVNLPRRSSSPLLARGRSAEPHGRNHLQTNGHSADVCEPGKSVYGSESLKKPIKASPPSGGGGFGRSISKKSLDMAIRHMDIRNGSGNMRPLPSTSLFPQSIRSAPSKIQTIYGSSSPKSSNSNGSPSISNNGSIIENGAYANGFLENGKKEENGRMFRRLSEVDMYESTRYDAILLKEDLKNTTWLHSIDDKSDQCSIFDNGFEPLPEPFGL